jgi:hypothetical protein
VSVWSWAIIEEPGIDRDFHRAGQLGPIGQEMPVAPGAGGLDPGHAHLAAGPAQQPAVRQLTAATRMKG